ncbi:MAG: hypothetical protein V2A62_01705 [Candidatus Woesearchaeota archaeon]
MLNKEIIHKINDLVAQKPRTVQEISQLIGKNWHTTESYLKKIAQEQGTLALRTFREGTRGALKIVYWNASDNSQSTLQEMLFHKIIHARNKEDFNPFDIYQYIDEEKRTCFIEEQENNLNVKQDLIKTISSAQQQVLIFSGDLSWAQAKQGERPLLEGFEQLIQKKVPIKILTNIDLNSKDNIQKIAEINFKYGKEMIEIRHCQQPLRAFVVDNSLVRIKQKYFLKKSSSNTFLFYSISDAEWVGWFQKLFWHFFSTAITAEKRIKDLQSIKNM